ncbi:SAM-dependent methyltransferase [Geofilum rubicundum]|uniref:Tetrapyrrole methylase family protein n=1 Tax=Geofilum rubicundum JCM 15548 TaxID=1236989 RepID=A0A0E9LTY0_9BACT|nr:SAM-dependent methyltransferase [Geofilum rubicundum]GAO28714.1 tetrapyrrole methylase family protein [Geofilum rubicundum JCM 15548]
MPGKLYLIPNTLGSAETGQTIPSEVAQMAVKLRHFIVEDLRTARRYLRLLDRQMDIDGSQFFMLNKRTSPAQWSEYLKPLKAGHDVGIISEAGCPGVADPGAEVVKMAHEAGIQVVPMVGPSSILLAMMASGMNGQSFAFVGYIPIKKEDRLKMIKQLENRSRNEHQSQLFIETPFRNNHLAQDIINSCAPKTRLCIACNLTMPDEYVVTKTIAQWKGKLPELHKKPTIFIVQG